jgi:cytochrome b6-f complex iron-sulfur subunit
MTEPADKNLSAGSSDQDRRRFLSAASQATMAGGLLASYGTLAYMAGSYLYPSKPRPMAWIFVAQAPAIKLGDVLRYQTPAGQPVSITRRAQTGFADDFLALSSTCPHLGCQVHWEAQNKRFFCPCHNGAFDASGKAVSGPPAEAGQSLPLYALKVENDLLFIQVPVDTMG